jgi:ribosomal protein S18 acetylase RimI-like enzyme
MRAVGLSDAPAAARTLAGAFFDDPVWGWLLDDPDRRFEQHFRLLVVFVEGAIEHGWVWSTPNIEAVSLWIPPGLPELNDDDSARLDALVDELLGARAALVDEAFECFEAAHPRDEAHFYLSFLGTDPSARGRGAGMQLLRETLARIDAMHQPAYLESTNPVNLARYESVGFRRFGEFQLPAGGPVVTTMWRPAR